MKKAFKINILVASLLASTAVFAAEVSNSELQTGTVTQEVENINYQLLMMQQKAVIDDLMVKATEKRPDKNIVDWINEEVKKAVDSVSHNVGKPEKPAVKNEYGGYAKDAWLTEEQEKAFYASVEFKETNERNQKVMKAYFEELSKVYNKINEFSKKPDLLTLEEVKGIQIPVLPVLSERDKSFMMLQDIVVWEGLNDGYVNKYLKPQLERLELLAQINVEYDKFKKLSDQANKTQEKMLADFEKKTADIEKETEKMSEHFKTGKNGELIFDPKINVKMPEIKDFMANCYLLDDVGQKLKAEQEKLKEQPKIEIKEVNR